MNDDKKKLGKILLQQKVVTDQELDGILEEQKTAPGRLASKVLEKGYAEEIKLLKALSEQSGVPGLDLRRIKINLKNLDLVPREISEQHGILPVLVEDDRLFLVMADPSDVRVQEELEFVSGKKVFCYIAIHKLLVEVIRECYNLKQAGKKEYRGSLADEAEESPGASGEEAEQSVQFQVFEGEKSAAVIDDHFQQKVHESKAFEDIETSFAGIMDEKPAAAVKKPAAPSAPKQQKKRILVVDDDDEIRLLITRVLKEKGYEVLDAARGNDALQMVQQSEPDMIILDAMLPEVHGFDICRKIKGSQKLGRIPVIMISAIYRGWRYAQDLKESYGVDAFIEKPFKIGELLQKVEGFLLSKAVPEDQKGREQISAEAEQELNEGVRLFKQGDLNGAIKHIEKGISLDPLAFRLYYHLALLYGKKGNNYQAIQCLENALELAPDYFPALKNLAVLYQKTGFKYKAIETWERAIGRSPDEETRREIKDHLMSLL